MDVSLRGKPFYLSKEQAGWVKDTLRHMTQEEKIGQLFVVLGDAYGAKELDRLVEKQNIGGVLFRPDMMEAVRRKYERAASRAKYPLLKCANLEEGGAGVLADGTYFGSQMQVAAANDMECVRHFAAVCAEEGKQVGVNWNFAPVADIDWNDRNPITNVRTFGGDAKWVEKHVVAYVEELQGRGMAAACKHFPGDGVDYRDQHLHPTYSHLSAKEWYESYGKIYESAIAAGLLSVMAGHIVQPNVILDVNPDAKEKDMLPGSLCRELLTGVLREKYGFNGVIITDATIMGGYTMAMERKTAIPMTIAAGCDMICFTTDIYEDISYVKEGIRRGILSVKRLDEAVTRILALKAAVAMCGKMPRPCAVDGEEKTEAESAVVEEEKAGTKPCAADGEKTRRAWALECADKAITLVKNKDGVVPFSLKKYRKVRLMVCGREEMYDGNIWDVAEEKLVQEGLLVERYNPFEDDLHGTAHLPKDRITILFLNYPTESNQVTVRPKWCDKHALEIPRFVNEEETVAVSLCNPYHLQDVPRVSAYINAYAATRVTLEMVIDKLLGKSPFQGISPVDAFCNLADTRM